MNFFYSESYHLNGFVVGDCKAVEKIMSTHSYTRTVEDTVAAALHAGTDLDYGRFYAIHAQAALDNKAVVESYFDPPEQQLYRQLSATDVDTSESRQLALNAAEKNLVLLINANKSLPLDINQLKNRKITLVGPTVQATLLVQGDYLGPAPYLISPVVGFENVTQDYSINIAYAHGCLINSTNQSGFAEAIELARSSDVVISVGGINQAFEHEAHDRISIALPDIQ